MELKLELKHRLGIAGIHVHEESPSLSLLDLRVGPANGTFRLGVGTGVTRIGRPPFYGDQRARKMELRPISSVFKRKTASVIARQFRSPKGQAGRVVKQGPDAVRQPEL
jgi:hypothetical protein